MVTMKVLITAGGTSEKIDSVRTIANIATGKLGSLIADNFAGLPDVEEIYYVCAKTAVLPKSEKATVMYVRSVSSLEQTIRDILERKIDVIIHSMAVSDYRVRSVSNVSNLARLIAKKKDMLCAKNERDAETLIAGLFNNLARVSDANGKIDSDVDDMLLIMEKTPKITSRFKNVSPASILVGFKLMDGAPREELIDTAFSLLKTNKCRFVLANDLSEINGDAHIGYLIDESGNYQRFMSKQEIADGIFAAVTEKRRGL
jgi:phosphopantothenate-cysteine ligase